MADPTTAASRLPATTAAPDALVIGAGPGGLAAAAALRQHGLRPLVVERAEQLGASWRGHYDRLHLHTTRRLSALPGLPIPRRYGRWVGRDDVVRYLEQYAEHHDLDIATGITVERVERADGGWELPATGGRVLASPVVVVATGHNHTPYIPDWKGRDTFSGDLVHASAYRNARPYAGRDVLVVGVGNTGAEIAVDLAEGGAARVRLAVRTAPHILRRSTMGWPAQASGIVCRRLPVKVVDRLAPYIERAGVPDLSEYGLPRPEHGLYSRVLEGAIPVQDVGLVKAVLAREVRTGRRRRGVRRGHGAAGGRLGDRTGRGDRRHRLPARAWKGWSATSACSTAAGGRWCTGRKTPPGAPGLYFTGFTNPISGMFREMAIDAGRIARSAARR